MQHHGSIQMVDRTANFATSPSMRFHPPDQKSVLTQTGSTAEPKRQRTSLVGKVSEIQIVQRLIRLWKRSWTAEALSCIFALLSMLGLVATLLAHENRPLPQWPQLVSLNSIVSLFSLLMRASVGVVLAEGWSQIQKPTFSI